MDSKYLQPSRHGRIRQKRTQGDYDCWSLGENPIKTAADLMKHLQIALSIELGTIPPYLCALYSIKDSPNADPEKITPARIIHSVVMEEMLHLLLVANLINSLGGKPVIGDPIVLKYPGPLPANANRFEVRLLKFSQEAIEIFLQIEKPFKPLPLPKDDKFHSIGQFYAAIQDAIEDMYEAGQISFDHKNPQVPPEYYYGGGGNLIIIDSIEKARHAINEIVGQGEGIDNTIDDGDKGAFGDKVEIAHYFRFNEIAVGRKYQEGDSPLKDPTGARFLVDWDNVYNMKPDPKLKDFEHVPEVHEEVRKFNRRYSRLLDKINEACNGTPESMGQAVSMMYKLKDMAIGLMKTPIGIDDFTAGPTFEYEKQNS